MVHIQGCEGRRCLAVFYPQKDGKEISCFLNNEENINNICKVIQRWNCVERYHPTKKNCQHFASEIFESLGIHLNLSIFKNSKVGYFLEYAKKNSISNPCLVDKNLNLIEGASWDTHAKLELWQEDIMVKSPSFFKEHESLLKGFHRGFQFQEVKDHPNCYFREKTLAIDDNNKPISISEEYESTFLDSNLESGKNIKLEFSKN